MRQWSTFYDRWASKAIVKRSRWRNNFLKDRTDNNQKNFKVLRNICKNCTKLQKKIILQSSGHKKVTENKTFWKTIIPLFIKRSLKGEKLTLLKMAKIFLKILNYVISSMVFSLILFPNSISLKSISASEEWYGLRFSSLCSQRIHKSPKH